jgi:hypothetical protein
MKLHTTALGISAALTVLVLVAVSRQAGLARNFHNIDDVAMMLVVSGRVVTTEPESHMLFSHILLGEALAALYAATANVSWYGLCHLTFLTLGLVAHFWAVGLGGASLRRWLPAVLCALGLTAPMMISPQFTMTAFSTAQGGLLLLLAALRRARGPSGRREFRFVAGSLPCCFWSWASWSVTNRCS